MRFLVDPTEARLARARAPVRAFLAFAALAVAALLLQRAAGGGLSPTEVELHYLGTGEGDGLPRAVLWEELHAGAFLYGFVLFMVGSLLSVTRLGPATRRAIFAASLVATLADLASPFVVVALGGGGALRVGTTLLATAALATGIVAAFVAFGPGSRRIDG